MLSLFLDDGFLITQVLSSCFTLPRMTEVQGVAVGKVVLGRGPKAVGNGVLVIQDFEREMNNCKPGDHVEATVFKVKENFFGIRVYPNGSSEAHMGYVSVFIMNMSDNEVTVSKFTISHGKKRRLERRKY